jgi:predicted transcriptional regulator with HTH domain
MEKLKKVDRLTAFGYKIHHSMSRSITRRRVLIFFRNMSSKNIVYKDTIFNISKNIKASPDSVRGAVLGTVNGFKKDEALISLGLVHYEKIGSLVCYYLTPKGFEVAEVLEE